MLTHNRQLDICKTDTDAVGEEEISGVLVTERLHVQYLPHSGNVVKLQQAMRYCIKCFLKLVTRLVKGNIYKRNFFLIKLRIHVL